MSVALHLLVLVAIVGAVAALAGRFDRSAPLALVLAGVGLSFAPGFDQIELTPDLVLIGLLPPLLYAAALRSTSLVDLRVNKRPIIMLSVGLVAFSTVAVGLVSSWVLPGASVAAAFCLGAVVAPTDAVAATAIGRRVGMPRRLVAVLNGESLINDATALVALGTAVTALSTTVSVWHVGWTFARAAVVGVGVGLVAALVLGAIRRRIDEPVLGTTLSLAAPYVAFLPAQELKGSGVLAVVVTGIVLGHQAPRMQSASPRLAEYHNWSTVQFLLENIVFLLIGLQLRRLVTDVADADLTWTQVVGPCLTVLLAVVVTRVVWVFGAVGLLRLLRRQTFDWRESTVLAWAGMRGVVTLAAVFLLPADTPNRSLLALAAFTVVAGTLLLQGSTLPWVVRRAGLPGPNAAEDALQYADLVSHACLTGLRELDVALSGTEPPEVVEELRQRSTQRTNRVWEQLGRPHADLVPPSVVYRRLRLRMLTAERGSILDARDRGVYDDEVLRQALHAIDLEESMLDPVGDVVPTGSDLAPPPHRAGDCDHLRSAPTLVTPRTPQGCEECLRDGTSWVHLRLCLSCGHVGCCDSSPGNHATGHYEEESHPVMRSFEPGEAWRWCYVDHLLG